MKGRPEFMKLWLSVEHAPNSSHVLATDDFTTYDVKEGDACLPEDQV